MKDWLRRIWVYWPSIVFVTLLNGGIVWYGVSTKEDKQARIAIAAQRQAEFARKRAVWQKEWAQVLKEKEIAPGETIRLVQVPSPEFELISSRCLIYTNYIFRSAQIMCSDWNQTSVSELAFDRVE